MAALAILAVAPRKTLALPGEQLGSGLRFFATGTCGVLLILGFLAAVGTFTFGSPASALAYLRGESLTVEPRFVNLGDGHIGDQKRVVVQLHNWTDEPVRIHGGTSDCSCVMTNDLPLTVAAGETRALTVIVDLRPPAGRFTRWANLLTNDAFSPTIAFRLTGRSYEPSASEE